jgi:hypothetical protein
VLVVRATRPPLKGDLRPGAVVHDQLLQKMRRNGDGALRLFAAMLGAREIGGESAVLKNRNVEPLQAWRVLNGFAQGPVVGLR